MLLAKIDPQSSTVLRLLRTGQVLLLRVSSYPWMLRVGASLVLCSGWCGRRTLAALHALAHITPHPYATPVLLPSANAIAAAHPFVHRSGRNPMRGRATAGMSYSSLEDLILARRLRALLWRGPFRRAPPGPAGPHSRKLSGSPRELFTPYLAWFPHSYAAPDGAFCRASP